MRTATYSHSTSAENNNADTCEPRTLPKAVLALHIPKTLPLDPLGNQVPITATVPGQTADRNIPIIPKSVKYAHGSVTCNNPSKTI